MDTRSILLAIKEQPLKCPASLLHLPIVHSLFEWITLRGIPPTLGQLQGQAYWGNAFIVALGLAKDKPNDIAGETYLYLENIGRRLIWFVDAIARYSIMASLKGPKLLDVVYMLLREDNEGQAEWLINQEDADNKLLESMPSDKMQELLKGIHDFCDEPSSNYVRPAYLFELCEGYISYPEWAKEDYRSWSLWADKSDPNFFIPILMNVELWDIWQRESILEKS